MDERVVHFCFGIIFGQTMLLLGFIARNLLEAHRKVALINRMGSMMDDARTTLDKDMAALTKALSTLRGDSHPNLKVVKDDDGGPEAS